ncbi:MAG: hypothetical protein EBQ94_05545 [Flavobacteriales bacterium]|jgi:hypothetical protein|nr:hypothetical protein [Crocinitomicaceae bacterium]NBX79833.1 hypothetical protein [Flavobacteriales bacterium]NCA21215.1 hypothetical protein [Crocinitomicaceae bacterium]
MKKLFVFLFITYYAYAIVRYHIGKDLLGVKEFFFVLNKAIAWTAGTFLLLSLLPSYFLEKYTIKRRAIGTFGYTIALIHILSSILLLDPILYAKFYSNDVLSVNGWTFIVIGALSAFLFTLPLIASLRKLAPDNVLYRFGRYGVLLNLLHVGAIGINSWMDLSKWPFYLPPITLIFVLEGIAVIVYRYWILKK